MQMRFELSYAFSASFRFVFFTEEAQRKQRMIGESFLSYSIQIGF